MVVEEIEGMSRICGYGGPTVNSIILHLNMYITTADQILSLYS